MHDPPSLPISRISRIICGRSPEQRQRLYHERCQVPCGSSEKRPRVGRCCFGVGMCGSPLCFLALARCAVETSRDGRGQASLESRQKDKKTRSMHLWFTARHAGCWMLLSAQYQHHHSSATVYLTGRLHIPPAKLLDTGTFPGLRRYILPAHHAI